MLSYAFKRIIRSWKLYASLILGMMLAATFFGGINVGADTIGKQALDAQLANTPVDISLTPISGGISVPRSSFDNVAQRVQGVSGVVAAESLGSVTEQFYPYNSSNPYIRAIQDNSLLYQHLTLLNGREISSANESVINADSQFAQNYKSGETVAYALGSYAGQKKFNITLKVVGVVQLDTAATNTLGGTNVFYGSSGPTSKPASTLIVSWDKTFNRIADWAYNQTRLGRGDYSITAMVNVYLDRPRLLSAFNVEGSITQVQQIDDQVSNVAALNGFNSQPNLIGPLQQFSSSIFGLRVTFTIFSIPVFFVAWFVGRTVSQASFNLRRREIGLLMTKGFSQSQLFRHFLVEALLVGLIGGGLGLAAAVLLNPYFVQVLSGSYQSGVFLSQDTAIATMIFTVILTLLAIYSPARAAATMDPAKALREYVYLEDTRPSKKRGAIVAFSLGLYKIILLLLGINFQNIGRFLYGVNFLLAIVLIIMAVLDYGLNIIGPFLFLYGATQLSTGLATRFHKGFASFSKRLVGDIASLASKSVFRNPRRVTALVFLVALIAGYSIWVIGDMASLQDYNIRQAEVQVGSDLRVSGLGNFRFNLTYATLVASQLRGWSNITGATPESDNSLTLSSRSSITIKAIDPATWRQGAYYEPEWFSGDINTVFQNMQSNSSTIVLDHGLASYYSIQQGGAVIIGQNVSLTVIGFFGPDYSQQSPGQPFGYSYFQPEGWSFVPLSLFTQNPSISGINSVLVKAGPGVSFTDLASSIQKAYPSLEVSTAQDITQRTVPVVSNGVQTSAQSAGAVIANGTQNVLRLGTVFAGLAASIGIGAVTYTGFKEREKETTMLAVRGLSYKQMLGLLVTEVLPLVIFALILATAVGLITVRGDSLAQNSLMPSYASLLAPRRVVFPLWASENILAIIGLLFLGVFLPAITAARKDLSKMSRTVRFA
jgi:ABC-type antimicrobial peptide transport system permease subunit